MSGTTSPVTSTTSTTSTGTDADTAALRADIADTREHLGETVDALADKADVKSRAKDTARRATARVGERARTTAGQVNTSVRQQPGRWAGVATGVLVGAAAVGVVLRRRNTATPQGRAARAWSMINDRRKATRWSFAR